MNAFPTRIPFAFLVLTVLLVAPSVRAEPSAGDGDEEILQEAGLSADGPALLAFFHARARMDVDGEQLRQLLTRFAAEEQAQRAAATTELLGLGALALQALRQSASDLDHPEAAARAARCLPWLEGPSSHRLLIAAARRLAEGKPDGAAAALLAFLPFADDAEIAAAINAALASVAAPHGRADAALLRGLSDRMGIRRAAAGVALCRAVPPEQVPDVRKLLKDPAPAVRLRAARALAEAKDAEAIPVLIDLLAELSAEERQSLEELLKGLAGEWALTLQIPMEDEVGRRVRRDAWASWWRLRNGPMLLAEVGKHTLTSGKRRKMQELLAQLGSEDFTLREDASRQLRTFGLLALPQLRRASQDRDAEVARRAKILIDALEKGPDARLPLAALRLLAVRKPAGAVEALLAYLPFAEDEMRADEVRKSLTALARRDGKLDASLRRAVGDTEPRVRAIVAEVLIQGGGAEGRAAVRKLLRDDTPSIRLRAALALVRAGERDGVAVLIDLLPLLSAEEFSQAEEALDALAGDTAPELPAGAAEDKKKSRDPWAAWWKVNAERVEMRNLSERTLLGYTLICGSTFVTEVDRRGKTLWSISNLNNVTDARMLPGGRVLVVERNGNRVTERDRKGNVLWKKDGLNAPCNAQRLPNGNTFLALDGNNSVLEVDRTGKEIYRINNLPPLLSACRMREGSIVCVNTDQCLFLDATGKRLRTFAVKYQPNCVGCLDVLANGRILLASLGSGKVMEYDDQGKLLKEWDVPQVTTATGLPNGHILASSNQSGHHRVVELDRDGKVVWEHKIDHLFRARRR